MKAIMDFFGAVLMLALVIAFGFLLGYTFRGWNETLPVSPPAGCIVTEEGICS